MAILNTDDRYFGDFRATPGPRRTPVTYGSAPAGRRLRSVAGASLSLTANRIEADSDGTCLIVHGLPGGPRPCRIPLHGHFNVANVLAALACAVALGADPDA